MSHPSRAGFGTIPRSTMYGIPLEFWRSDSAAIRHCESVWRKSDEKNLGTFPNGPPYRVGDAGFRSYAIPDTGLPSPTGSPVALTALYTPSREMTRSIDTRTPRCPWLMCQTYSEF